MSALRHGGAILLLPFTVTVVVPAMIAGVSFVLLGEATLAAPLPLLIWFVVCALGNAVYIPVAEEAGLGERFGDDYRAYRRNEPRWVPRMWPREDEKSASTVGKNCKD
jgi:protein-S-isoprenylcysteine O-methyltransferase Ste14